MKNGLDHGARGAIPSNCPPSAMPEAVRDLADLLAQIAVQMIRSKQLPKKDERVR